MFRGNVKLALDTIRNARWRNTLTTLGIVIGVVSVITTVSLGEGIKRQVVGQVSSTGNNMVVIRPGKTVTRDKHGTITSVNIGANYGFGNGSLVDTDITTVKSTAGVKEFTPISVVTGQPKHDNDTYQNGVVIGANESFFSLLNQKIEFGQAFTAAEERRHVAVIGKDVAEKLLKENVPVGLTISIRGQDFVIRGIFENFNSSPLNLGTDLNKAVIIPYPVSKQLMGNNTQLAQIWAQPDAQHSTKDVVATINKNLRDQHEGQEDFTVLRQDENLTVTSDILNILTAFIAGIAAISLIVGGIGIMDIMLVSVSERTREIGVRKALGATNRQILSQFLVEATALSCTGGILGILFAYIGNFLIRISTNLKPVTTWQVVLLASGVSILVGIIFGIAPAIKAARKDPIEALRYE